MQTSSSLADGRATPQKEIHAMNFRFVYIVYFCSAILHLIQGFALLITPASLQPQAMTVQGQHFADVAPSSRPLQQTCLAASGNAASVPDCRKPRPNRSCTYFLSL